MIAKMAKYDFVLYAAQSEDFIEKPVSYTHLTLPTTPYV